MKKNNGRQNVQRSTKQVRIDSEWHKYTKVEASKAGITIKDLLEGLLAEHKGPVKPLC